jgi:hypothetical protein
MVESSTIAIVLKKTTLKRAILFLVEGVFLFALGIFVGEQIKQEQIRNFVASFKTIRENGDTYNYINPLIGTVSDPATDIGIFSDIQSELKDYIALEKNKAISLRSLFILETSIHRCGLGSMKKNPFSQPAFLNYQLRSRYTAKKKRSRGH